MAPIPLWAYEASAAFYFGQHLDPAWDAAALDTQRRRLMDELKSGAATGDAVGPDDQGSGAEAFARALPLLATILGLKS